MYLTALKIDFVLKLVLCHVCSIYDPAIIAECVEIPSVIEPFFPLRDGFSWLNDVDVEQRIRGSEPPAKKEECEVP